MRPKNTVTTTHPAQTNTSLTSTNLKVVQFVQV